MHASNVPASTEASESPVALYRRVAAGLRAVLELADIAAAHGRSARSAEHVLGGLEDLAPELAALARLRNS